MKYVAAIDQGTTSSRCLLFDASARIVAASQREHRQIFPQAGWVEHDPVEIWKNTCAVIAGALQAAGAKGHDIAAVGVTNQRETVVAWDTRTGAPFHNALVWQDTRTAEFCATLAQDGGGDRFRALTGLPIATYFSASKMRWLLDHVPALGAAAAKGHAAIGTIDSWLLWNLTAPSSGRPITDVTNASRTQLMNLHTRDWDDTLLQAFGVPRDVLPRIVASTGHHAHTHPTGPFGAAVPITAILGDQQAALVGQTCFAAGECKNTYGTGNFLLMNTGEKIVSSSHGLLTTVAYQFAHEPARYALEGSVAVSGALVQWLRDNLGLIEKSADVEALAASVPDTGGVCIVPAFSGLFAPYWRPDARGTIVGLTRFVTKAHIARAALEAVAFQTRDVLDAMAKDAAAACAELKVDGGMTANNLLLQIQSDTLGIPVLRPEITETTALGAAFAAGLAVGYWPSAESLRQLFRIEHRFTPTSDGPTRDRAYATWKKAIERSLNWA